LRQSWQIILEMTRHDPAAVFGFVFLGASGVLSFHILLKLNKAGYPLGANAFGGTIKYLKLRATHGWSPWPAYLSWVCLAVGVALLFLGLFRLVG
jgi:hypothetical protein